MSNLLVDVDGPVLTVTFNRPSRRNAMTWDMYEGLFTACDQADADDTIRVMVLRGAGPDAFVAGTDIVQFADFQTGADGINYEERISRVVGRLEEVSVPTIAAVRGFCVGGGLILASVCDLRLATKSARFGAPMARTLGNCLSMNSYSLLVHHFGAGRTLDLLLRARLLSGDEAHDAGFVAEVCEESELDQVLSETVAQILAHSPLSMWAAKEAVRRLRLANLPAGDDIVARVFGSDDFHRAVKGFLNKSKLEWTGR
jgi:enoyl-CoA hydratase/carnithine racemase